jgi:hypothetical protein
MFRHEMFRDEHNAWLIAKSSVGISEWFNLIQYEGRPPLFFILLRLLSYITRAPEAPKALMLICGICTVIMIMGKPSVSWWTRLPMMLTLPFFGAYFIYVRDYALVVLFLSMVYRFNALKEPMKPRSIVLMLLLMFTNLFGWMFAAAQTANQMLMWMGNRTGTTSRRVVISIQITGLAISASLMIRPLDSISPLQSSIESSLISQLRVFVFKFNEVIWPISPNSLFQAQYPHLQLRTLVIFAFGFAACISIGYLLWRQKSGLVSLYLFFILLFCGNLAFGYAWYWWHFGMFHAGVITVIFCAEPVIERLSDIRWTASRILVMAFVIVSMAGNFLGPSASVFSATNFSNAKDAAALIQIDCPANCLIAVTDNSGSVSLAGYLNTPVYSLVLDRPQTHFVWSESATSDWSWQEVDALSEDYFATYVVLEGPVNAPRNYTLLQVFDDAIWENYWVYKRTS